MLAKTPRQIVIFPLLWCCGAPATVGSGAAQIPEATELASEPTDGESTGQDMSPTDSTPTVSSATAPNPAASAPAIARKPKDTRTPASIQAAITAHRPAMRTCYEEALKTNPGIAGDLVIQFVIRPDGSLKEAEINWPESDIHVPELENCALEAVQTIRFPTSSRGMESRIHYPYNFHPGH